MLVLFLRHAEAEPAAGSDFDRRLTAKGLEQATKAGRFCHAFGLVPDLILTSPVVRARQTAEIVAHALKCPLEEVRWLSCGMSPEQCLEELGKLTRHSSVLLVGHEPDFSETLGRLLGVFHPEALKIRKSSLTGVELPVAAAGAGQLQFLLPARLMGR